MSNDLKTSHPLLMVPHVVTFGVVIYTNGPLNLPSPEALREAIARELPHGCGVSSISYTNHGVYEGPQGALRDR